MRALGIILAGGNNNRMRELSQKRSISAMPIAGSYRSIDFVLSNMAHSHIQKAAVITQYNSRVLHEHLSSSKWWDFGRKQGGLYTFTPTVTPQNSNWYRGTADSIYQNILFLKRSHEPYVVIATGDCIYKMDYNKLLEYHIAKKADITVAVKDMPDGTAFDRYGIVKLDEDSRIVEFDEKPMVPKTKTVSCGMTHRSPLRILLWFFRFLQQTFTYSTIPAASSSRTFKWANRSIHEDRRHRASGSSNWTSREDWDCGDYDNDAMSGFDSYEDNDF